MHNIQGIYKYDFLPNLTKNVISITTFINIISVIYYALPKYY